MVEGKKMDGKKMGRRQLDNRAKQGEGLQERKKLRQKSRRKLVCMAYPRR